MLQQRVLDTWAVAATPGLFTQEFGGRAVLAPSQETLVLQTPHWSGEGETLGPFTPRENWEIP